MFKLGRRGPNCCVYCRSETGVIGIASVIFYHWSSQDWNDLAVRDAQAARNPSQGNKRNSLLRSSFSSRSALVSGIFPQFQWNASHRRGRTHIFRFPRSMPAYSRIDSNREGRLHFSQSGRSPCLPLSSEAGIWIHSMELRGSTTPGSRVDRIGSIRNSFKSVETGVRIRSGVNDLLRRSAGRSAAICARAGGLYWNSSFQTTKPCTQADLHI